MINRKRILRLVGLLLVVFFAGKKILKSREYSNIKRINQFYYSGEFQKTKTELESHLVRYPGSSESWSYLGLVNLELNDTINSEIAYKKSYQLDPKNDKALIGLGIIHRIKKNYDSARVYYNKAIEANPSNPDIYSSLVVLELKNKNYHKAVELGEKAWAMKITDTRPGVLGNLVIAYHYNKQFEERDNALKELEKLNYQDIEYIKMVINEDVDLIDML